ncbi:TOMM precursor leader peptide-binding protein [Rhodocyclaceae bacterium]
MIAKPIFKTHLHVAVLPGEGVLILSETLTKALHGAAYEKVVPLIDGRRSSDAIVDALADEVEAAKVYYVLQRLEAQGYLAEAHPDIAPDVAAFWYAADIDPAMAQAALQEKRVAVQCVGAADDAPLRAALEAMGVRQVVPALADLWLVLTDDYLNAELDRINTEALQAQRPWLLVRPTGRELWLGPLFQPGETGCWACLRQRLERNRAVHRFVAAKREPPVMPLTAPGGLPATQAAACQMAAEAAAQFLAGADGGLAGKMLSLDWSTHTAEHHALVRHPHCPACGTAETPRLQPLQLQPGKAAFVRDGGHRAVPPEKTLKTYAHLVSPITGVVRMLASVSEADGIAHVYMAGHNHAMKLERLDHLKQGLRNASSGKGVSETQAKASALCEAIERYSGERTGGEVVVTASYAEMQVRHGADAIHPNAVMRFSARQLAEHEAWNARKSKFNRVTEPLPDDQPIDWTPVWSLKDARHKYLPTQLLYYASPASAACDKFYSFGCSNGNASGNTLAEAILQGFFELVERDAVALWWYNRLRKPGVATETFGEPWLQELAAYYDQRHQRDTWALDVTSDLGIPVFVAVSKCREGQEERLLFGLGCHLDARIALQRAFAEMNQMLGLAHAGEAGKEDKLALEDSEVLSWLRHATLANQPYMAPDPAQPPKRFGDYPLQHSGEFLTDLAHCRRPIEARGMEMLVLDQTRADVGMPVAKVIVPGLRHFWARYGEGRLYDVPVQMGWLPQALREDELNPIAIFF